MNPKKTKYADIVLAKIMGRPIIPKADDVLVLPVSEYDWFECSIGNIVEHSNEGVVKRATIYIGEILGGTSNLWSDQYDSDAIMAINGHKIKSNKDAWDTIIPF